MSNQQISNLNPRTSIRPSDFIRHFLKGATVIAPMVLALACGESGSEILAPTVEAPGADSQTTEQPIITLKAELTDFSYAGIYGLKNVGSGRCMQKEDVEKVRARTCSSVVKTGVDAQDFETFLLPNGTFAICHAGSIAEYTEAAMVLSSGCVPSKTTGFKLNNYTSAKCGNGSTSTSGTINYVGYRAHCMGAWGLDSTLTFKKYTLLSQYIDWRPWGGTLERAPGFPVSMWKWVGDGTVQWTGTNMNGRVLTEASENRIQANTLTTGYTWQKWTLR